MQCLVPNMMSWWIRSWIGRLVDVERNVDHSSGSVDGWFNKGQHVLELEYQ